MQALEVLTLVVAGIAFIAAIGSLFLICWTRKTILQGRGVQPSTTTTRRRHRAVETEQIALAGIAVVFVAFLVVLGQLGDDKTNLGTLFGTVTAAVGTLVGLIVGHHAGSAGRDRAEERSRPAMEDMNRKA
jgi:hypothetical protein